MLVLALFVVVLLQLGLNCYLLFGIVQHVDSGSVMIGTAGSRMVGGLSGDALSVTSQDADIAFFYDGRMAQLATDFLILTDSKGRRRAMVTLKGPVLSVSIVDDQDNAVLRWPPEAGAPEDAKGEK